MGNLYAKYQILTVLVLQSNPCSDKCDIWPKIKWDPFNRKAFDCVSSVLPVLHYLGRVAFFS